MFGINYRSKNLTESLLPILIFNWIFGHQLINYSYHNFNFLQTFIYLLFILIIYSIFLYFSISYLLVAPWFEDSASKYLIVVGMNISISSIIFILGWIFKKKAKIIDIRNQRLDKRLEELGLKIDAQKAFNFSLIVTVAWIINVLIINLIATLWILGSIDSFINITSIYATHHPIHMNNLINLTFGLSIRHMGLRFRVVNQAIAKFEIQNNNLAVTNDFLYDKRRIINNRANSFQDTSNYLNHLLQIFREVHLELTKLCSKTTQIFGFQIVMTMLSLAVLITSSFYNVYLITQDTETRNDALKIVIFSISITSNCLNFFFVNHFCSETVNEWKQTGQIIHKLEVESKNTELCRTIQQFLMQMTQNPLFISPCGFIELGYSFVQSFVGTITTYLVILIQMSPQ